VRLRPISLEAYLRAEGDLPELEDEFEAEDMAEEEDEPTSIRPAARKRVEAKKSVKPQAAMTVGGRTLTRNPLPHEIAASVDFEGMDADWTTAQQSLVEQWANEVKAPKIEALVTAIAETDS
jgi:hypothetical protein